LARVATMGDAYRQALARTSLTLTLLAITAAMALSLGLLGIYGVISYMLAQRTREIGVRMALGARNTQLQGMLLRQVFLLVTVGVALGLGGAAALTRLMESMLFGVTALDAPTFAAGAAALVATAIVAGYLPARRITRIDPMRALREE
ncbi:MAG TPA: FtsX-like permease family protein, partial [Gammaproteobacteria bacterium]|nr:FtsX-like permease family protein [Gammaproteobacteria bacterium]